MSPHPSPPPVVTSAEEAFTRLCSGPESIPMEIAGSREFVMVTLPGASSPDPIRFHVDTGGNTPGLMLLGSVAARLGFASADALPRTLRIGDREIALPHETRWILLDPNGPEAKFERAIRNEYAVGQIGAGFLSRFVVCIDPAKQRIGLGDPAQLEVDPGASSFVPLVMLHGGATHALYPFLHVQIGEQALGMLLDTGATTSMLDRPAIDELRHRHADWPTTDGAFGDADMIGGAWDEAVLRADDLVLDAKPPIHAGPATLVDRPSGTWSKMFGDAPGIGSRGAIANDVLLRYRLLVDYPHARLFLQPSGLTPSPSASSARVGVSLVFDGSGCPQISQITDSNAKAAREALRVGDVIVAVDGHETCKLWHHEIAALLAGPSGTSRHLRVRRNGGPLELDVVTAELLR